NFVDWRSQTRSFSVVAAIASSSVVLTGSGEPARLSTATVSWNFFSMLGVEPALGRSFRAEEDQPGRNRVAILSYTTWIDRFGGRADIVGSGVIFNDATYTIVGVLPRDFEFAGKGSAAQTMYEVWTPLALDTTRLQRGTHPLRVWARLASHTDLQSAQAE